MRPSELLEDLAKYSGGGELSVGRLVEMLGHRSFALAILILALPNTLPVGIPGVSTVTGVPILIMALQLLWGRRTIWLPRMVAEKRIPRERLSAIIRRSLPVVLRLERFLRPRLSLLCEFVGGRGVAFLIALLGAMLSVPVIGGNFLPGVSIALLALALLERDGLLAAVGILFAAASVYFFYAVVVLADGAWEWLSAAAGL